MNLQQFQEDNPDLWPAVREWIREGWASLILWIFPH